MAAVGIHTQALSVDMCVHVGVTVRFLIVFLGDITQYINACLNTVNYLYSAFRNRSNRNNCDI